MVGIHKHPRLAAVESRLPTRHGTGWYQNGRPPTQAMGGALGKQQHPSGDISTPSA
jgi:hypothetical protein